MDRLLRRAKLIAVASEERGGLSLEADEGASSAERVFDGDDAWQQWLEAQRPAVASSFAGAPRSRSAQAVELRAEAAPGVAARLSPAASRALDREALKSRPRLIDSQRSLYAAGLEVGGYLFGNQWASSSRWDPASDALVIDQIIGAGANAVSTPTSITYEVGGRIRERAPRRLRRSRRASPRSLAHAPNFW